MTREEWEYATQEMKVEAVKLPDSDKRKAELQDMVRTFEAALAFHANLDEYDPDEAQRFIVGMAKVFEACLKGKDAVRRKISELEAELEHLQKIAARLR